MKIYETYYGENAAGIPKIKLPLSEEELTADLIGKWLPSVLAQQKKNAKKIEHFLDYVNGIGLPIESKERKFEEAREHNNKIKQNHAYAIVAFKEGFLLGDKRELAQKDDADLDDLIYLDRYLTDVSFYSKDLEVKHNVYASGIGTSFIYPRTDIIVRDVNGSRFKRVEEGYDVDSESPFVYECVDSRYNAVVYTSKIGARGAGDLFCFNISYRYRDGISISEEVVTVYTRRFTAQYGSDGKQIGEVIPAPDGLSMLPMVEHSVNSGRIGCVEIIETSLDAVNTIISNCVDNVVDRVNQILVFLGCEAEAIDVQEAYENGALCIPQSGTGQNPGVDKITLDMNYADIITLAHEILVRSYDVVGVPLSGSTTGNGNNQAAYIGGGWTNAMIAIKRDVCALEQSDMELIKRMLAICRLNGANKVRNITASQIDNKYNVKITDNILSYSQALQNFVDAGMPYEHILKAVPLWSDTKTVAKDWRDNAEKIKRETEASAESPIV